MLTQRLKECRVTVELFAMRCNWAPFLIENTKVANNDGKKMARLHIIRFERGSSLGCTTPSRRIASGTRNVAQREERVTKL